MMTDHTGDCCPNCAAPLQGPFCSTCGQHQVDLDQPLRDLVALILSYSIALVMTMLGTLIVTVAAL